LENDIYLSIPATVGSVVPVLDSREVGTVDDMRIDTVKFEKMCPNTTSSTTKST
jgi:hypothetical protein